MKKGELNMKKHIEYLLDSQLAFLAGAISFMNMENVFESFYLIHGGEWKMHSITNDIGLLTYSMPPTFLAVAMALLFLRKKRTRLTKIVGVPAMAILLYLVTFIFCYISSLLEFPKNEIIKMYEFFSFSNIPSIIKSIVFSPVVALSFFIAGKLKNKNAFLKIVFMPAVFWIYRLFFFFFIYLLSQPDPDKKFEDILKIYYISNVVLSQVIICSSVALIFIGVPLVAEVYYKKQQLMKKLTALLALLGVATLLGVAIFAQETFTDPRDSKKYKTVRIGNQIWMAENLNFNASGSKCYDNDLANCEKYGRLYDWETAKSACPSGWHLPSKPEWEVLTAMVGGEETEGKYLKATSGWNDYEGKSGNGTDAYGFSALPGGYGNSDGGFGDAGSDGFWWSATEDNGSYAYNRGMFYYESAGWGNNNNKSFLFSVRCVED
jgi:uncharacterized protein (TIGR02145 family)